MELDNYTVQSLNTNWMRTICFSFIPGVLCRSREVDKGNNLLGKEEKHNAEKNMKDHE